MAYWLRHYATNWQVAGSIPDGVVGIFQWHNPSGRSMALGSTQPLTGMSLFSWRYNPLWLYFHSPVTGFSLLVFEVSWSHTTTPLDEWSIRRRDLYLTTHNTHNRQTSMPPVGFEPTISAGERPKTYALDRAATGTDNRNEYQVYLLGVKTAGA